MPNKFLSYSFVCLQFACIGALVSTGPIIANGIYFVVESAAIVLGMWALLAMRGGSVRILPDVSENATLIKRGPYRVVRHPMYTAVIMLMVALVFNAANTMRVVILGALFLDLLGKLFYEEKLLKNSFDGYGEYCKTTWRLVPFIF